MLSASTARLVEHVTELGAQEWVHREGRKGPLPARLLLGFAPYPVSGSAGASRRWSGAPRR